MPDRLVRSIRESNRQSRGAWGRFAAHRAQVTGILASVAQDRGSLAVLGPGNLDDVDLSRLLDEYSEIHLVDLDADSLRSSLAARAAARPEALVVHAPVDLTGILDRLHAPEDAEEILEALARHRLVLAGAPFGVTASTGTLTQLLQSVHDSSLPRRDVDRVVLALRDKHLLDLVHLTSPGGALVLVSDVVSTTTAPGLAAAAPETLEERMAGLVAAKNFFTGTNPYRIVALLEEDGRFRDLVTDVRLVDPWLWPVTPDRRHLTYAIVAERIRR